MYCKLQGAAKKARQSLANKWSASDVNFSESMIMSPETPVSIVPYKNYFTVLTWFKMCILYNNIIGFKVSWYANNFIQYQSEAVNFVKSFCYILLSTRQNKF